MRTLPALPLRPSQCGSAYLGRRQSEKLDRPTRLFARMITDFASEFDYVRESRKGPLYAEISPRAFRILVWASIQVALTPIPLR